MISWQEVSVCFRRTFLFKKISFTLGEGAVGIVGLNKSGKTSLAEVLSFKRPCTGKMSLPYTEDELAYLPFHEVQFLGYGITNYRQLRWNTTEGELIPTVSDKIKDYLGPDLDHLLKTFKLHYLLNTKITSLSNGETRKLQIILALLKKPKAIILDNPYVGLDIQSRALLNELFNWMVENGILLIVTALYKEHLPSVFKQFLYLPGNGVISTEPDKHSKVDEYSVEELTFYPKQNVNKKQIEMRNVCLKMGERSILKDITWDLSSGEAWEIKGANGAGKTSLLNLVFADNPKAYTQQITLFGKVKGSGESIWDIKRKIGFISPELHQYFSSKDTVLEVVCTGLSELERTHTKQHLSGVTEAETLLKSLGLLHLKDRWYTQLSTSEQRIVLFLRALIKAPEMLILDEPFQGLDKSNIAVLSSMLQHLNKDKGVSVIFVSHFAEEVPFWVNKRLQLEKGAVTFCGSL